MVLFCRGHGLRAAGDNINLSAGAVSESIQRLENRLGTRLIERTTRKMALTEAGERLFQKASPVLKELTNVMSDMSDEQNRVSGILRLSAPRSSSTFFLDDLIAKFGIEHPEINVELIYEDQKIELVNSGVDAAIRSQNLLDKETHAVSIGPDLNMALVVSPAYLATHGKPNKPTDLVKHDGIRFCFNTPTRLADWAFVTRTKGTYFVNPQPRIIVNNLDSMIEFARKGLGIAYVYQKTAQPYISSGELVTLFDRSIPTSAKYSINYLTKRHMPARLRAFIDFSKQFDFA